MKAAASEKTNVAELPSFLGAKNLKPFISNELATSLNSPIEYMPKDGRQTAHGYRAELLPEICEVWLKARDAGVLRANQVPTAIKADILMRGLAHVGIISLIDEVTGYQAVRQRDELAVILQAFVAKELQKWVRTFDASFYQELFRLRGLSYSGAAAKPGYIGHLTNDLIYSRLAPAILDDLRRKNPVDPQKGRRKNRHHQWLTREFGHPSLQKRVEGVTVMMRLSRNWAEFYWRMNEVYPKLNEAPYFGFRSDEDDGRFASKSA